MVFSESGTGLLQDRVLSGLAGSHQCATAQVILSWLLQQGTSASHSESAENHEEFNRSRSIGKALKMASKALRQDSRPSSSARVAAEALSRAYLGLPRSCVRTWTRNICSSRSKRWLASIHWTAMHAWDLTPTSSPKRKGYMLYGMKRNTRRKNLFDHFKLDEESKSRPRGLVCRGAYLCVTHGVGAGRMTS